MDLELVDIALRGTLIEIALVCVGALWINGAPRQTRIAFTLMALAGQARTWGNLPPGIHMPDEILSLLRYLGAAAMPLFTWTFITLFMDDRRYFWGWIGAASVVTVGLWSRDILPLIPHVTRLYALVFTIAFLLAVILSARDDLINKRRRARLWVASSVFVHVLVVALITSPMVTEPTTIEPLVSAVMQLLTYVIFTFWAVARNEQTWMADPIELANARIKSDLRRPTQIALVRQIEVAMQNEVWRQEGLTLSGLAQQLGTPEHQVRTAINRVLGHRNFPAFINQARIEAAKNQLSQPEHMGKSVQEIAYSVGFNSTGPFNRAFREDTGQSPSDFRNAALTSELVDS